MSAEPDHAAADKRKVKLDNDPSGAEAKDEDATATAILKKKKKPNSLIVTDATTDDNSILAGAHSESIFLVYLYVVSRHLYASLSPYRSLTSSTASSSPCRNLPRSWSA